MKTLRLVTILFVCAFAVTVSAPQVGSVQAMNFAILSIGDSDGTVVLNTTAGTWSYSGSHGAGSGTMSITNQGGYFTLNGSGTYGIDGFLFGNLQPGGGSGFLNLQGNSGGSFSIFDSY